MQQGFEESGNMNKIQPTQKMFVAVAGNIGSGKTTLTKKLSQRLNWKPQYEPVDNNPYLADFYKDMSRWSFELQVYFLTHRFNSHRLIECSNFSAIQDRSIYEDAYIFARSLFEKGHMSKREYENYYRLFMTMTQFMGSPTLMIFLKRSVHKLMERIRERGRECEKEISTDYISQLNEYYHDWYETYNLGKAIIVDTDDLDFLNNEDQFERLVQKIQDSMEQQELFYSYH
ncbi:MAG: deoxynucleoside kinase [Bdellovibrionota bacterium]|nr:deoxynucleoside kinase [Bdellovibrionota bacterium]|tara:strand:- start:2102 stop:2791 length:690 start_codon:yes stop_codon:yes gene_type:complete